MKDSSTHTCGPYSPIRQAGDFYYVSGQIGLASDKSAAPDVEAQTHQALQNLENVLQTAGLEMADVIKTTVFVKNIDDFTLVNDTYVGYFPEPRPARSCVEVVSLPRVADNELLIEIEAVAYKSPAKDSDR